MLLIRMGCGARPASITITEWLQPPPGMITEPPGMGVSALPAPTVQPERWPLKPLA